MGTTGDQRGQASQVSEGRQRHPSLRAFKHAVTHCILNTFPFRMLITEACVVFTKVTKENYPFIPIANV